MAYAGGMFYSIINSGSGGRSSTTPTIPSGSLIWRMGQLQWRGKGLTWRG